jgi:DNA-binding response OmpR family regulator
MLKNKTIRSKMKILLAEDDLQLGFIIKDNLEENGFDVINCPDGESAWDFYQKKSPDLCILDVNMPYRDGFSVAKKIRQKSDTMPIIFLTAKSLEEDVIKGFEIGADDYVTKPFRMKELLMRINVFLRRNKMLVKDSPLSYQLGSALFIPEELKLVYDDETVVLTVKERQLLEFLCQHPGVLLKREEVLSNVWGKNDFFLGRSMDVFVNKLRKHLKRSDEISIETIHGVGFRFSISEK